MAYPTVLATAPPSSLFSFPPSNEPQTLPAPAAGSSLTAPPFSIPPTLYKNALDFRVPVTIACVYAVTVTALNAFNRSNGNKAWSISKTKSFFWFMIAHNVFLAVYSAWTFVGMFAAMSRSFAGWNGPYGLVGAVDSLCKMHGTSGLSNAITYNPSSSWISQSPNKIYLGADGTPDSTDLGRLWNEGLAFYGWFFYLSKFYEVLDTAIILAKGKRSSTLQTYHHAGAMMCMWAGIRYMSPPIWMFVLVNSGIHALMYTYYTLTAFSIPIPQAMKRSLTTMQIIQFLVGASYAALHSFVSYTIPIQVPTTSPATTTAATAAATASTSLSSLIKKLLLRAAGEGGLAANVASPSHLPQSHVSAGTTTWTTQYQTVACIDTSGQTFAIWLNVLYLTPLTALFVRFFVKSYIRRSSSKGEAVRVEKAGLDALKGVEKEMVRGERREANGHANGHVHTNGHANRAIKN